MKKPIVEAFVVLAGILAAIASSAAQDRGPQLPPDDRPLQRNAPAPPPQPRAAAPREQQGSASDNLSRSGGVLQPPDTGDDVIKSPPRPGEARMPVIPPPGTPGGSQSIQPK